MLDGISLIPSHGNHTQNIPPITSVSDKSVSSAAWICFEPIEYKIRPMHTKEPCVANKAWFLLEDKKFKSWFKITKPEIIAHIKPAIDTVVNFGVCLLHLRVTENIAKPNAEANPKIRPINDNRNKEIDQEAISSETKHKHHKNKDNDNQYDKEKKNKK